MSTKAGILRRRRAALLGVVAAAALSVPASSASAGTVYGGPLPISYANPDITISPGESLTFTNLDVTAPHDVTALAVGSDFRPLFRSETVGFGVSVPVVGAEKLASGAYPYICSIHSNMRGTVTVSGPPGAGRDNKAPAIKVKALDRKAGAAAKSGKLRFKITSDEPATLRLVATKGKTRVAEVSDHLKTGANTIKARLTNEGKKLLRRAGKVTLKYRAVASDSNGNRKKRSGKVKLR